MLIKVKVVVEVQNSFFCFMPSDTTSAEQHGLYLKIEKIGTYYDYLVPDLKKKKIKFKVASLGTCSRLQAVTSNCRLKMVPWLVESKHNLKIRKPHA